jgi:hypothetical protein
MGPEFRDREILIDSGRPEVNELSATQSNAESNEIVNQSSL